MAKQQRPDWAQNWFAKIIEQSKFKVRVIPLKLSKEWIFDNGAIAHKSGLFFKIVGVSWGEKGKKKFVRPLIEQREIGTLGFLFRNNKDGPQILVQAKIEPGNIGLCQIGPSLQATASNAARVHGGKAQPYRKYFEPGTTINSIFQTLQSEQGSRFLGKLNRNIVTKVDIPIRPTPLHKWIPTAVLLSAVDNDNFINTDARSVLVCMPWDVLMGREPFAAHNSKLTQHLRVSYGELNARKIQNIHKALELKRAQAPLLKMLALDRMPGWKMTPYGVKSLNAEPYAIKQITVNAVGREVAQWDQPVIDSSSKGAVDLYCAMIDRVLRFYFVPRAEAGLLNKVELGPSVVSEPGQKLYYPPTKKYKVLASVNQSDEGGRFFRDVTRYRLVQIPSHRLTSDANGHWLTLGEIKWLLKEEGIFTNEARSVLSLLLKWV